MRNLIQVLVLTLSTVMGSACAAQPVARPLPVPLAEVTNLGQQGLSDQALIDLLEQRGLDFALTSDNENTLRAAGASEGVIRYLQGRAAGERDATRLMMQGRGYYPRYYSPAYYGDPYFRGYHGLHANYGHFGGHHYNGGHPRRRH